MGRLSSLFCLGFCLALLFNVSTAQMSYRGQRQSGCRSQHCQVQKLRALEPNRRIEAEGGVTEIWEQSNANQLECAAVSFVRTTIRSKGLVLPVYSNAAQLTYVVQGEGLHSQVIPGCPETYQSFQQSQQQFQGQQRGQSGADEHQKVRRLRRGDVVATPAGVTQWYYNDANTPLVLVTLIDTGNNKNQLDHKLRGFFLAGNPQGSSRAEPREAEQKQGPDESGNNIFSGFDDQVLEEVLGVRRETVEKIKGRNDYRGHIIIVKNGLQMVRPSRMEEEEEERRDHQVKETTNGLEETLCTARMKENIGSPSRADIYNPQAGHISTVNRLNLPILNFLQLSAERGTLFRNAIYAPHWNLNAHSIIYVTRGSAHVQIVGNYRNTVYNGQLRAGQLLVVPQNFAVMKQAGDKGFEWVSFKTGNNAMTQPLAGKTSPFRGLPVDMLANMYQIQRQEAENLKYGRGQEMMIFPSSSVSTCRERTCA